MIQKNFLNEELFATTHEKEIVEYKYQGTNGSLLYAHITGPFAQWLVDHILPSWLA